MVTHSRHDPLHYWAVVVTMGALQFGEAIESLLQIYSIVVLVYDVFVDSFQLAKIAKKVNSITPVLKFCALVAFRGK